MGRKIFSKKISYKTQLYCIGFAIQKQLMFQLQFITMDSLSLFLILKKKNMSSDLCKKIAPTDKVKIKQFKKTYIRSLLQFLDPVSKEWYYTVLKECHVSGSVNLTEQEERDTRW